MTDEDRRLLERFSEMYDKAEVYYAYSFVHRNVASPFRTIHSSMLFNMCRFVLMRTLNVSQHHHYEDLCLNRAQLSICPSQAARLLSMYVRPRGPCCPAHAQQYIVSLCVHLPTAEQHLGGAMVPCVPAYSVV